MSTHKTMNETLALCDYTRAKRTEPLTPLIKLRPDEQHAFWRRKPLLLVWRERLGRK